MVMMCGWSLVSARPFVFIATIVLVLWFRFVLIPFEERELRALFGSEWEKYSAETPMLVPFTKRSRHASATLDQSARS
jgi:protein-S-isoprenylcysteine O-methyltransferase Ste14